MIDFKNIYESIVFYENQGYKRIESPWTVSEYVSNITKPKDKMSFQLKHNDKHLVASGEQSFLYLYLKGFLPKGKYQTTTPCFRFEPFDSTHTKYFIKNELIITDNPTHMELARVVQICHEFYKQYFNPKDLNIEHTEAGHDITVNGDELGSYGIRTCDFLTWIYATGCAEPRMSFLIQKHGGNSNRRLS